MEAFMRILASAIAIAVALAWPNVGEAQSKKSTARGKATTQQKVVRQKKTTRVRTAASPRSARPCAGYLWWGCVGWDPDPHVRSTLVRDYMETP
jgi:hypothetical protein